MSQLPFRPDLLPKIANQFGTPTYVYSEEIIRRQIERFATAFGTGNYKLLYAMKANSSPWALRTMLSAGVGIDAVSPAEALLALRCGFAPDAVFYSANNCSDVELDWATEKGFVINIGEYSRLDKYVSRHPGQEISIRLNLNIGAGHHDHVVTGGAKSKFGIHAGLLEKAVEIAHKNNVRIAGLHQHIGSGSTDPEPLAEGIAAIGAIAQQVDGLRFVNMGGGFGVSYKPNQPDLDLEELARLTADTRRTLAEKEIAIWFEPGRYLLADAGVLLVSVNTIKETATRVFAGTDSGMNHLIRPALYSAYHGVYNLSNPGGRRSRYDVVGNICETGDFFAREREVPEIREGDLLAVLAAGAYSNSMSSMYNLRPKPAEVAITTSDDLLLLAKRKTADEVVDAILADDQSQS